MTTYKEVITYVFEENASNDNKLCVRCDGNYKLYFFNIRFFQTTAQEILKWQSVIAIFALGLGGH